MKLRGKKLLILCDKKDSFESLEAYLAHKGVYIKLITSVEGYFKALQEFEPHYCLVSIDNKDPYVSDLIENLRKAEFIVIPTAETHNLEASKRIDEYEIEYSLFPPINGQKLENILMFLEKKQESESETLRSLKYEKKEKLQAKDSLDYTKEESKSLKEIQELFYETKNNSEKVSEPDDVALIKKAIEYEMKDGNAPTEESSEEPLEEPPEFTHSGIIEVEPKVVKEIDRLFNDSMSSIKGCKKVEPPESLRSTRDFTVYAITTEKMSGYILTTVDAAVGDTKEQTKIEGKFVESLTRSVDGPFELQRLTLSFEEFDFKDWIETYDGVLKSFQLQDMVVSWAFLQKTENDLIMSSTEREDMVGVNLSEITPEVKAKNDLYLHLPSNNKFLLYTKEGNNIASNQFLRLNKFQIKEMHIKKDDIDKFKDYKVEKEITSMVKGHKKDAA